MRVLIFIFIFSLPALCSAQQVFKWRDKNGNTHYSDVEPASQNAQRKVLKAPPQNKVLTESELACERAKLNLKVLTESEIVQMDLNNDGKLEQLNTEQRAQQTEVMKTAIKAKCTP